MAAGAGLEEGRIGDDGGVAVGCEAGGGAGAAGGGEIERQDRRRGRRSRWRRCSRRPAPPSPDRTRPASRCERGCRPAPPAPRCRRPRRDRAARSCPGPTAAPSSTESSPARKPFSGWASVSRPPRKASCVTPCRVLQFRSPWARDIALRGRFARDHTGLRAAAQRCGQAVSMVGIGAAAAKEQAGLGALDRLLAATADEMDKVNALILKRADSHVEMVPELARYLIEAGGKRLRPMLTVAAALLFGKADGRADQLRGRRRIHAQRDAAPRRCGRRQRHAARPAGGAHDLGQPGERAGRRLPARPGVPDDGRDRRARCARRAREGGDDHRRGRGVPAQPRRATSRRPPPTTSR